MVVWHLCVNEIVNFAVILKNLVFAELYTCEHYVYELLPYASQRLSPLCAVF